MPARWARSLWAAGAAIAAVVLSGAVIVPAVTAAQAPAGRLPGHLTSPGEPGTPQPPTPLYTEDFSHQDATSAGIPLPAYTGSPGTVYVPGVSGASSQTYYADPNWDGRMCDGWILNGSSPLPPASSNCTSADWSALKTLVNAIGVFQGMTAAAASGNQALSEYTDGNPGAGIEFQTSNPMPAVPGHFYQVTAVFGEMNCPNGATMANLTFSLIVNGTPQVVGSNLVPCTAPGAESIGAAKVVSLSSSALPVTGASPTLGLQVYNSQGSGGGNDVAFDLPQIMDVTPQLDKSFSPGTIASGGVSTLTFVITNTDELAAKNGWSFTDNLPAGVTATGVHATTCPAGTVTAAPGAGSVAVSGNLSKGMTSCSVTVQVTASAPGTYTDGPGNFPAGTAGLNGLNPPGNTTLTVAPPPSLVIAKQSATTALTAAGQVVTYKFVVTNRSAVTLTGVSVADVQEPPATPGNMSAVTCAVSTLASGDSTTCYGTYTVTQADVANGSLRDSATASGTNPAGGTVTSPPSVLSISLPAPAISVVKSSTVTKVTAAGQQVPYSFLVTNTGNVTLTGVTVTDAQQRPASPGNMSPVTCPDVTLAAGASETCTATYTVTQADLNNGAVSDSAVAAGTAPDGSTANSPPSALSIPAQPPGALSIAKATATVAVTSVGQAIPYTFQVTNDSAATVNNITVTDTVAPPSLPANLSAVTCPSRTLAPGASVTCTATYQTTQADLNAGVVSNTAQATGTDPAGDTVYSGQSTVTLTVPVATISIVKAAGLPSISVAGQQVPYTFTVTNTGNQPLTGVSVTDTQVPPAVPGNMSPVICPQPTLAAGQSETCTGTYTVAQADIASGSVNDYAVANGTGPSGAVTSPQSSASVPVQVPALTMVKSSPDDSYDRVGQQVSYGFTVANLSTVTYTNIQVQDTQVPPASQVGLSAITCPQPNLPAGTSETCTATYTVTQADLDHGTLADDATATAVDPLGATDTTPRSSVILPAAQAPALSVAKSTTTADVTRAGQLVPYSFLVTNTGNVTLTGVTVTDTVAGPSDPANLSPVTCLATTLAPGAATTCTATYTVTQADVDHGTVGDTATAHGTPPSGPAVDSPPSPVSVPVTQAPALSVVKSAAPAQVGAVGDVISYSFDVTNNGNVTLANVTVTDTQAAPAGDLDGPVTCLVTTLSPGASTTCAATYTVTQADVDNGSVSDSATASGSPPSGPAVTSPPSGASVAVTQAPALTVVKSTTTASVARAGQVVPYSFLVTDTGNVTLAGVAVTDTVAAPSDPANLSPVTCPVTTLAPGDSVTCTATYTVTQADVDHGTVADSATAAGTPPSGPAVDSPPSPVSVPVAQAPALTVVKSTTTTSVTRAGQQVPYSFLVTNTGNVTLRNVTVTDTAAAPSDPANLSPVTCPVSTLAPGDSVTCTATYTVTQADVDHGSLADSATVTGDPPATLGNPNPAPLPPSPPSDVTVSVAQSPSLAVVKSAPSAVVHVAGDVIGYGFAVTNTGNVTLTGLAVSDAQSAPAGPLDGPVSCPATPLAPGDSVTCTATYTVTQADVDNGSVTDTAVASGLPPSGSVVISPPSSAAVPIPAGPAINIVKSVTPSLVHAPGDVVTYRFTVTNTGNDTLTQVAVADTQAPPAGNLDGPVTCPVTTLAPGASVTCTATYTVKQADLENGEVDDTATASGSPPSGSAVTSPPVSLTVTAVQGPALSVVKSTTTATITRAGQQVPYAFLVTNIGNVTMRNVTVTDTVAPPSDPAALSPVICPQATLAPGVQETCTATYTATQADVDHGSLADAATVSGLPPATRDNPDPSPLPPSSPSAVTVAAPARPGISVLKTAEKDPLTVVGEQVRYSFLVANTGNVTLTKVGVSDTVAPPSNQANLTPVTCPRTALAPLASMTCTATYTVTAADLAKGSLGNTAVAYGTPPSGPVVRSRPHTISFAVTGGEIVIPTGEGASASPAAQTALVTGGTAALAVGAAMSLLLLGRRQRGA